MSKSVIKKISIVVFVLVGIAFLIPLIQSVRMSFVDFAFFKGIDGSDLVGFEHYKRFFDYKFCGRIINNTLIINVYSIIIGAIYAFLASAAISSINKPILKRLLAFCFLIPALIPTQLYTGFINTIFLYEIPEELFQIIVAIISGLRFSAIVAVFALFINGKPLNVAIKFSLIFIVIKLITLFSTDFSIVYPIETPYLVAVCETISTFAYKTGINHSISYGATLDVLKVVFQILPTALAIFVFTYLQKDKIRFDKPVSLKPVCIAGILPIAILIIALASFSSGVWFVEDVSTYYSNSFVQSFFSAIVVSILSVAIAYAVVNLKTAGCVIVCVLLCISDMTAVRHMLYIGDAMCFSSFGIVVGNLSIIPMIALIIAFVVKREDSLNTCLPIAIVTFGALFAWFWNDLYVFAIARNTQIPMALFVKAFFDRAKTTEMIEFSFLLYMLVPLIVSGGCIFASGLIKDKKNDEISE